MAEETSLRQRAARWASWLVRPERSPAPTAFAAIGVLGYACLVFALIAFHEPWRDEADSWLAARDLGASEALRFTRMAGTPGLWYLLLAPLARAGAPYAAQFVLHGVLACGVAWLVLRHAPFSRVFKVLLLTSLLFGYEYAVVARSYALLNLCLFGLAALHPQRKQQPLVWGLLVAALANAHGVGAFFAAGIWLARAWEVWREGSAAPAAARVGLVLGAAGGLLALYQVWPEAGGQELGVFVRTPKALAWDQGRAFAALLLPWLGEWGCAVLGLAILGGGLRAVLARTDAAIPVVVGLLLVLALFSFRILPSLRHVGLVPTLLLYGLWVSGRAPARPGPGARRARRGALAVWTLVLVASLPATVGLWVASVRHASSGSTEMAEFMREKDLDAGALAIHGNGQSVLPYLRRRQAYYPGVDGLRSYRRWDELMSVGSRLELGAALQRIEARYAGQPVLVLLDQPIPDAEARGYYLLYACQREAFRHPEERFLLYFQKR